MPDWPSAHQLLSTLKSRSALIFISALVALLILGISIALLIYLARPSEAAAERIRVDRPDLIRPVRFRDFRLPELRLSGSEGDFFRYRDPGAAWSDEEIERLQLDVTAIGVDIVKQENRELLHHLLHTQQ